MTILIAPDSFKDCLPAIDVARALYNGIKSIRPDMQVILFPMADGGEGTSDILDYHLSCRWENFAVNDPLQRPIQSGYLMLTDRDIAVIELAKASGLELLTMEERNPLHTNTLGTGELIRAALDNDVNEITLSIGGSATVDGGTGIAAALGFTFYNYQGEKFIPSGNTLHKISRIDTAAVHHSFHETKWIIASDVQNILNGPEGAAVVYGPQKGADAHAVKILADGLSHLAEIIERDTGFSADQHPGTGAAGGAALFLMAYGNATLRSGFDTIAELTGFHSAIDSASLVITGEGKLDAQTKYGKVVSSIAHHTNNKEIPLIVVCGTTKDDPAEIAKSLHIAQLYSLRDRAKNDDDSIKNAKRYLKQIGEDIARKYFSDKF